MPLSIALQLYTLRHMASEDFVGMLRTVADAGYGAVEFAGYGGLPAPELRAVIDDLGLRAISSHVPYQVMVGDTVGAIEDLKILGCEHAVVPGLPPGMRRIEDVPSVAREFGRVASACRDAGLRFSYHNHGWEFEAPEGEAFLDRLAAATDPTQVGFQIDVYWALVAGADPVAWIRSHPGRIPTIHAKELANGDEHRDTTVGDGRNDWAQLLPVAVDAGTEWVIVEQEDDQENLQRDIQRSLSNLTRLASPYA